YDSVGAVTSSTGATILFLHEGVFTDPSTGMEWHSDPSSGFPGRWYDPAAKRWISEDPTGLGPDSNPYRSDHNSPTNLSDPSGLETTLALFPSISAFGDAPPADPWGGHDDKVSLWDYNCAGLALRNYFKVPNTDELKFHLDRMHAREV